MKMGCSPKYPVGITYFTLLKAVILSLCAMFFSNLYIVINCCLSKFNGDDDDDDDDDDDVM